MIVASAPDRLGVWLDGIRVADLEQPRFPNIRLRYTDEAVDLWPLNSPVVSCSLPLSRSALDAQGFCRGLLPEGQALQTLAANAGVAANATYELLARYGKDVAGALIVSEAAPEERLFDVERYSTDGLVAAIDDIDDYPLGSHDDSELSLAGLQDKLLLVELGAGAWGRPLHGRPSTHILKVDDRRRPGLVQAEARCLTVAREVGLTTIEPELLLVGDTECLVVSRFDRSVDGDSVRRVHQEDLCQALNVDIEAQQGRGKYESAGGPTFRAAARLLDEHARDPQAQLDQLARCMTFTVLIGNADAHGKNLAVLHPEPGEITLAPLYDTVPTILWPRLKTTAAMSIGGQTALPKVTLSDLVAEARSWNHPAARSDEIIRDTVRQVVEAAKVIDGTGDPRLPEYIRDRAEQLIGS